MLFFFWFVSFCFVLLSVTFFNVFLVGVGHACILLSRRSSVGLLIGWLFVWSVGRSVCWSVVRSVGRSVGRSAGRSVVRSVGRSVIWLVGRLFGWSVGCLVGRSVRSLISWLVIWLVRWFGLVCWLFCLLVSRSCDWWSDFPAFCSPAPLYVTLVSW